MIDGGAWLDIEAGAAPVEAGEIGHADGARGQLVFGEIGGDGARYVGQAGHFIDRTGECFGAGAESGDQVDIGRRARTQDAGAARAAVDGGSSSASVGGAAAQPLADAAENKFAGIVHGRHGWGSGDSGNPVARLAADEGFDIVDQLVGQGLHRRVRGPGHVRQQDEVGQGQQFRGKQRIARDRRLLRQHVETGAGDLALLERAVPAPFRRQGRRARY